MSRAARRRLRVRDQRLSSCRTRLVHQPEFSDGGNVDRADRVAPRHLPGVGAKRCKSAACAPDLEPLGLPVAWQVSSSRQRPQEPPAALFVQLMAS